MKLSIITINYNNREGLRKTIDSIISQTWQGFEWIIVDGGSTDGSRELIEKYQEHLSYWCSEPDKGVYNAMNKGIAKARGEYMNFMNSGDIFESSATLEHVFDHKLHGDVVYGDWLRIYPDHEELKEPPRLLSLWDLFFENICHQAMFIRGSLLREKGYDESYRVLADWKRWRDMAVENRTFQYIPVVVCRFEALTGLSESNSSQHRIDSDRLADDDTLPPMLRKTLADYTNTMKKFRFYEDCPLTHDTYDLVTERRLYQWSIHGFLVVLKGIKKVLDILHV